MWSPSDDKKKDDVDECRCSSGGGSSSSNLSEQQQQLNLFENNSKKPTATFTSNLISDDTTAAFHKEQELAGAHAHATESGDSGFISGPQTSSFQEEQPSGEDPKKGAVSSGSGSSSAQSYNINPAERQDRQRGVKEAEEKFVIDSGCIDEEEDDFDEADDGDEQRHEVKGTLVAQSQTQLHPQQQKKQNAAAVASNISTAAVRAEQPASAQPTDQMILKHDIDAGMSERFCSLSLQSGANINNLNAGAAATPTATAAASTPTATNLPPWEQYYQQNDDGDTYLHLACISGHDNVVAALIRLAPHPCLLNIQNDDGQTALHLAALTTQRRILRMLLLAGAEPTVRDCRGNTALHLACISGDEQCVSALTIPFSASEINEAHRQYGYRSNDKTVSSLSYASLPSDLEIRNYNGERCVHLAAQAGHIKILGILVQHGADINAREGRSGRTPLHISIENCNEELANFLLDDCKQKLDLETATFAGLTAYQIACILNKSQMQSILENRGAEPLTPPDSDYDSSDIETDLDDAKIYDRFGDPGYFASYKGGNPMTVA